MCETCVSHRRSSLRSCIRPPTSLIRSPLAKAAGRGEFCFMGFARVHVFPCDSCKKSFLGCLGRVFDGKGNKSWHDGGGGGVIMSIVLIGLDGKILTTWSTSYQKWRLRVCGSWLTLKTGSTTLGPAEAFLFLRKFSGQLVSQPQWGVPTSWRI